MSESAHATRILLVEDDLKLAGLVREFLQQSGLEVSVEPRGDRAAERILSERPDVVILDVMLPGLDGFSVCKRVRPQYDGGILMLTARGDEVDEVVGLELGADDYMAKPFSFEELQARLRALTRRSRPATEDAGGSEVLSFADLTLDLQTREVTRAGRRISLTRTEFALLQTFLENPRRVLERSWLLNEVWGFDFPTTANSLEVYIGYLRRKTEGEGEIRLIHTVRGIGYVLRETPP